MASLSIIQPYVDKENTSGLGTKNVPGQVRGLGGKVFQTGPPALTPRKALQDVRSLENSNCKPEGLQLKQKAHIQQSFKKPALKSSDSHLGNKTDKYSIEKKQTSVVSPFALPTVTKQPDMIPHVEKMHIYDDKDDLDNKHPARHLSIKGIVKNAMQQWRSSCLYGLQPDSEGEDELSDHDPHDLDLDMIDCHSTITPVDLPDLSFPELDMDLDLHMPFLDDSIDIESTLGSLEVTPMTPLKQSEKNCQQ